jgi:hypothetical protein
VITGTYGYTDTAWCAQGGPGVALTAGLDPYPDQVVTTLAYGPIDMSTVVSAQLQFARWISVAAGDGLKWGYSTNGANYTYSVVNPAPVGDWFTDTISSDVSEELASLLGQPQVYFSFRFLTNDDGQVDLGAFLDNVLLRVTYPEPEITFFPYMRNDAAPTPIPRYTDDFSDPSSGWPTWSRNSGGDEHRGGYFVELLARLLRDYGPERAAEIVANTVRPSADEPEVFYSVVHSDGDKVFISGPHRTPGGNFVYEVESRISWVEKWYQGNAYGILISEEKVDPADPDRVHGYSFEIRMNPRDGGASYGDPGWQILRWQRGSGGDENTTLRGPHTSKLFDSEVGDWDKIRIEREGSRLRVYVNDKFLAEADDGTYTGPMYIGFYCRHTSGSTTELSYGVTFEWDDVVVEPRP